MRHLIVNADDFGLNRDVNAGIIQAHRHGILTATTLMANGSAFDDAVDLAKQNRTLDVGVHLVFVQGKSVDTGHTLPTTPSAVVRSMLLGKLNAYREGRAQILKVIDAGIRPSHLDTHKHTHLFPAVFASVVRLAAEFQIPFVRLPVFRPFDKPYRYMAGRRGVQMSDHLAGYEWTGKLDEAVLLAAIPNFQSGLTELFCHPGYLGPELIASKTRLKESRLRELEALTSPRVRRTMDEAEVHLATFCKTVRPLAR